VQVRELHYPRWVGLVQAYLGMNLWLIGAASEAERTFDEIVLPDAELGYGMSRRYVSLSRLLAEQGAFGEAKRWALHLAEAGKARGIKIFEAQGRWSLSEVLRRTGELGAADVEITTAVGLLEGSNPLERPAFLATLAALRLAQGRPAEALAIVEDAMKQTQAMGACSRFFRDAFLMLTHIECLEAVGDRANARTAIEKAKTWVLNVAGKIGDNEYRRMFLEEVPENRRILELAR
jgi:ATP/maltotriose-dependent transcriptional regulator MalT